MLCFKLQEHGVTTDNYTKERAEEVARRCAGSAIFKHLIKEYEQDILNNLKAIENEKR